MRNDADYASAEHEERLWCKMKYVMLTAPQGVALKSSRWYNAERKAQFLYQQATCTHVILIYIGWRRSWWKSCADSPLGASTPQLGDDQATDDAVSEAVEAADDAGDQQDGGEALGAEDDEEEAAGLMNPADAHVPMSKKLPRRV